MTESPTADKSKDPLSPTEKSQQTTDAQGQLTAAVDDLLDQLQHKFDAVSREMFTKLDDMTRRLDELESSLTVSVDSAAANANANTPGAGTGPETPTATATAPAK